MYSTLLSHEEAAIQLAVRRRCKLLTGTSLYLSGLLSIPI